MGKYLPFYATSNHATLPPKESLSQDELLKFMKGSEVEIRDVDNTYPDWPEGENPHLADLRQAADDKLEGLIANKSKLEKLKRADFGLSVAMWYPHATYEDSIVILYFILWLFTWDDDIEELGGSVHDNFQAAQKVRNQTIAYVTRCLGFETDKPYVKPTNPLILHFKSVGVVLRKAFTIEQRQRFLKEIIYFVNMTGVEQKLRLRGRSATVDEYWRYRLGSSAVNLTTAMIELANRSALPSQVLEDADMKTVWKETNVIISTSNDMLSLKKEMAHGQVDTLIPLLCLHHNLQPQQAMDVADSSLRSSIKRFEAAAKKLRNRYQNNRQVREFVEGCQYTVTGNCNFSLVSPRYGLANKRDGHNLRFTL